MTYQPHQLSNTTTGTTAAAAPQISFHSPPSTTTAAAMTLPPTTPSRDGSSTVDPNDYDELKNLNGAMLKTSVCRHWTRGHCKFGVECGFAHGGTELRKPLKTALCRHYESGRCRKGAECGFAHGQQELGTPQAELLTIDSQEPLDPAAAELPTGKEELGMSRVLVLSSKKKVWRFCTILAQDDSRYKVHYDGYSSQFDEWLHRDSDRLIAPGKIRAALDTPTIGSKVIVLSKRKRIWRQCTVIDANPTEVKVHYDGYSESFDEWLEMGSERLRHYDAACLAGGQRRPTISSVTESQKSRTTGATPMFRSSSDESQTTLASIQNSSFAHTLMSSFARQTASGGSERLMSQPRLVIPLAPTPQQPSFVVPLVPSQTSATWAGNTMSDGPASVPSAQDDDNLSQFSSSTSLDSRPNPCIKSVSGEYTPYSTVKYANTINLHTPEVQQLQPSTSPSATPETFSLNAVPSLPPLLPGAPSAASLTPVPQPLPAAPLTATASTLGLAPALAPAVSTPTYQPPTPMPAMSSGICPTSPPSTFRHDPYAVQDSFVTRSPSNGSG